MLVMLHVQGWVSQANLSVIFGFCHTRHSLLQLQEALQKAQTASVLHTVVSLALLVGLQGCCWVGRRLPRGQAI